jgi:hypothetical protein
MDNVSELPSVYAEGYIFTEYLQETEYQNLTILYAYICFTWNSLHVAFTSTIGYTKYQNTITAKQL